MWEASHPGGVSLSPAHAFWMTNEGPRVHIFNTSPSHTLATVRQGIT